MDVRLLLRLAKRFGDGYALNMARQTLDRMAMEKRLEQIGRERVLPTAERGA